MATARHEVVISGMAGKFPECSSVSELKVKLFSRANLLKSDLARWDQANGRSPLISGKVPDCDKFDGNFFGVPPKFVQSCDPQLGHILEKSFEAIMDAGINPYTLKGRNVCVVTPTMFSDSEHVQVGNLDAAFYLQGFGMIGHSRTMMANRISYCYNLTGPSYNCDCSWTSALQGMEKAAALVAEGSVESAIVVASNLMFYNTIDGQYESVKMLSPRGKCSPFDAEVDGFVRSEAVVAFFIQRAQDAKRNYCTIIGTETRFLGDKPCSYIQANPLIGAFLQKCYSNNNVNPADVSYIEAVGICIKEFDAEELNAVAKVFCSQKDEQLLIGSVTGNLGNTECTSGFVSLAKAIIAMETGVIPPTVNYSTPNPDVPALITGQLKLVTEATNIPGDLVAVNCMSLYGSMGHVLVKRHGKTKQELSAGQLPGDGLHRLVVLQARHEEGAAAIIQKLHSMALDVEFVSLVNDVFKTPVPAYLWRAYAVLPAADARAVQNTQEFNPLKRPVWFVFSGMGSQWVGMGRDLLCWPVFAAAIDKCDQVLRPRGVDIKHILTTDDATVFDNSINCFVGITAIQIGLTDILRKLGVTPDGIIGHSLGEVGCSYADGCLTAEEAVLSAYARGRASIEADLIPGMMAAVGLGYNEIKEQLPPSVDVACHNSADNCTVSGPTEDVMNYVNNLKEQGVFAKAVSAGGIAYHSRYIKNVAPNLLAFLRKVIFSPKPRSSRWISSSVPESQWDTEHARLCSAEYLTNNLLNPVLFEEACKHLPKDAILIEIAPHGLLQAILRRSVGAETLNISLTNKTSQSNLNHFLNAVGKLYLNNVDVDVNALYPAVQYPVARGTPSLEDIITWDHSEVRYKQLNSCIHRLLTKHSTHSIVEINNKSPDYNLWKDHCIEDQVVVPVSQLLMYTWNVIFNSKNLPIGQTPVVIENATIINPVIVDESDNSLLLTFSKVSSTFEISQASGKDFSEPNILTGRLCEAGQLSVTLPEPVEDVSQMEEVTEDEVYCVLAQFGCQLGPQFRAIKQILIGESECLAKVQWTGNIVSFLDALFKIIVFYQTDDQQRLLLPSHFNRLTINTPFLTNLPSDALVDVQYNLLSNRLLCEGVELLGLTLSPVSPLKPLSLIWRERKLQPYFDQTLSVEGFLSASLQLASDAGLNSWSNRSTQIKILKIKSESENLPELTGQLKEVLRSLPLVFSNVVEIDLDRAKKLVALSRRQNILFMGEYSVLAPVLVSATVEDNVFCLAFFSATESLSYNQILKPILILQTNNGKLALFKKVSRHIHPTVFELRNTSWLRDLRQLLANTDKKQSVILICRMLTPRQVLSSLAAEFNTQRIRVVFILDQNAPQFSLTSPLYSAQLSLGLPINILSSGVWHTLKTVTLNIAQQKKCLASLFKSEQDLLNISCVGLNTTTFTLNQNCNAEEPDLKFVDYSGYIQTERVMGVGQFDSVSNSVVPDPILRWAVPADWTMEDASTIPCSYALAFYCVLLKAKLQQRETILIHAGASPLGQAVIRVSLHVGANIIASVTSEEESFALAKMFPSLKPANLVVLGTHDIAVVVGKLTSGKGVDVVINCLKGKDMQSSIKVMGIDCRFVNLSRIKIEDKESVGMWVFLRRTSFHGVCFDSINNCNDEWKSAIQNSVQEGIQKGIVKPLKRTTFSLDNHKEAIHNIKTRNTEEKTILVSNHTQCKLAGSFFCHPEQLAIIAGTRTELWLDVAEWLVRHGASKLIVLTEEDQLFDSQVRRFNKLMNQSKIRILTGSLSRFDSHDKAIEFLKEVLHLGLIVSIFCIGMDENNSRLESLDSASRELVPGLEQFVSLLGEGAEVCESRAVSGLPVCCVQSDSPLQTPANVLPYLSTILADNSSKSRFFLVSDAVRTSIKREVLEIQSFLPSSVEEIYNTGLMVADSPCFAEVVTLSPGHCHTRYSLLPVFVVSGMGADCLQPLFRQLIHPAFCSSLPVSVQSVKQFAQSLLEDVVRIQQQGPYNLVGESWSGGVALQLGTLLEARGHEVQLILLEGDPSMSQEAIRDLCDCYSTDLGSALLADQFNLPAEAIQKVSKLKRWEDKLQVGMRDVPASQRDTVEKAISCIHSQLTALLQFQPSQLFRGQLTLITHRQPTPAHVTKLSQFCEQLPKITVVDCENHNQLIRGSSTASVINQSLCFTWKL